MIEYLRIKNLVLMEECKVEFHQGLNIITGETGAGKTALTQGLYLLMGERADTSLLRKGAEKAFIDASFDITHHDLVVDILHQMGIDFDPKESLVIARELSREGKSRAFIHGQPSPLSCLQAIAPYLLMMIGQHSYHDLKSLEKQKELLDCFGKHQHLNADVRGHYDAHKAALSHLSEMESLQRDKKRNYQRVLDDLKELTDARLQEGEEEELFDQYSLQSQSQEIAEKCKQVGLMLSEGTRPILKELSVCRGYVEGFQSAHPLIAEACSGLQEALVQLQEVDLSLQKVLNQIEISPKALSHLEKRLSLYERIKKKYGSSPLDWQQSIQEAKDKLTLWDHIEDEMDAARSAVKHHERLLQESADQLSHQRASAASHMALQLTQILQECNMPSAEVFIEMTPSTLGPLGQETIQFFLKANPGELRASLREGTSGGELSRLLLAIQTSLAENNLTSSLLFDEIDANVGGETAAKIAEKLLCLSKHKQVICITHFPQVAAKADRHFKMVKQLAEDRTVASVHILSASERKKELMRMLGGDDTYLRESSESKASIT